MPDAANPNLPPAEYPEKSTEIPESHRPGLQDDVERPDTDIRVPPEVIDNLNDDFSPKDNGEPDAPEDTSPDEETTDPPDEEGTTPSASEEEPPEAEQPSTPEDAGEETPDAESAGQSLDSDEMADLPINEGEELVHVADDGTVTTITPDLVEDVINNENWKAKNTQRAQELAQQEQQLQQTAERLMVDDIRAALIGDGEEDPPLMQDLDVYFEDLGQENPFRQLDAIQEYTQELDDTTQRELALSARETLLDLKQQDSELDEMALVNFATEHADTPQLALYYHLMKGQERQQALETQQATIAKQQREIAAKNAEISKLRKTGPTPDIPETADGRGAKQVTYDKPADTWGEATQRMLEELPD